MLRTWFLLTLHFGILLLKLHVIEGNQSVIGKYLSLNMNTCLILHMKELRYLLVSAWRYVKSSMLVKCLCLIW